MKRNSNTTTKKNKNGGNPYARTALTKVAKGIGNVVGNVVGNVGEEYLKDAAQNGARNKYHPGVNLAKSMVSGPSKPPKYPITLSRPGGRRRKSKRIRTCVRKTCKR